MVQIYNETVKHASHLTMI